MDSARPRNHAYLRHRRGDPVLQGEASHGRLGRAGGTNLGTPTAIDSTSSYQAVKSSTNHTCALTLAGELHCWGRNQGEDHFCALQDEGDIYCWGRNWAGALGTGRTVDEVAPARVNSQESFRALTTGTGFSCALTVDDDAYCWGANGQGQLGIGSTTLQRRPTLLTSAPTFQSIDAGRAHACGLTATNQAFCWGANSEPLDGSAAGRLGDGTSDDSATPVPVSGELEFAMLSVGSYHSCGLDLDGAAYCWGDNGAGQLGTGSAAGSLVPVIVPGDRVYVEIAAGATHTCALNLAGHAFCWGQNQAGQLGTGDSEDRATPRAVLGGREFVRLLIAQERSCGVTAEEELYCWGLNREDASAGGISRDPCTPASEEWRILLSCLGFGPVRGSCNHLSSQEETLMNRDQQEGKFKQFKGKAKRIYGELTDDDVRKADGSTDKLMGIIQEKFGDTKEKIQQKMDEFGDDRPSTSA